jgi:hypothetical protein
MIDLMRARSLIALSVLAVSLTSHAAFRPIGRAPAEFFGGTKPHWLILPLTVDFDPSLEQARLRLSGQVSGQLLTARLDFKRLPGYGAWIAQRQAQGGPAWAALKAVLDELGDGPAMVLTHEKLPVQGPAKLLVGLRRGSHFQLYATVPGSFSPCGSRLCFEPGTPVFASRSAGLAWSLLKPLALREAKGAASR